VDGPTRSDGSSWLVPAAFLILAALLALLLVRELDQNAAIPVPDNASRSIGNTDKGSPPSTGEPEAERRCDRATNNPDLAAVGSGGSTRSWAASQIATKRRRNLQGGYSFRYAPHWNVSQRAEITRVIGPGHGFVISFGPGPAGGLPAAFDDFAELVRDTYRNVRVNEVDVDCVGGYLSAEARGRGTNDRGAEFEFLAMIIKPSPGQAVGAFGAWRSQVPRFRLAVTEVIDSFQANPPSA
jgi:hypothetical protein